MPQLHLTKVAFGCRTIEALEKRVAARARGGEVRVVTRMRPKRADELVGGSLHWIVKHRMVACQQILRFEDRTDGRIDIVCSAELDLIPPSPKRAHQGWRYLEDEDAPDVEATDRARGPRPRGSTATGHARPGRELLAGRSPCRAACEFAAMAFITSREARMTSHSAVSAAIDAKVAERAMLSHPFYQAWTEGRLPLDTLRDYARQYFHHVEAFPRAVSAVHSACPDRDGRRMLAENLAEEEGIEAGKQDHASLWMMFACGLGENEDAVRGQALNPETEALIETFRRLSRRSYASGLGALYAYESQFPGVASAKIEGLIDRYGIKRRADPALLPGPRDCRRRAQPGVPRPARPLAAGRARRSDRRGRGAGRGAVEFPVGSRGPHHGPVKPPSGSRRRSPSPTAFTVHAGLPASSITAAPMHRPRRCR